MPCSVPPTRGCRSLRGRCLSLSRSPRFAIYDLYVKSERLRLPAASKDRFPRSEQTKSKKMKSVAARSARATVTATMDLGLSLQMLYG